MKILQINKFYFMKGGSERHLFELSGLLRANGHQVIPFSMKDEKNLKNDFENFFAEPVDLDKFSIKNIIKYFYNRQAVRSLQKLISKEKPEIAHLHNIAHQLSPAIIKVLKKNNIPIVQTLHDYKMICPNYMLFSKGGTCTRCKQGKYYNCLKNRCVKNSYPKSLLATLEAYLNNDIYQQVDLFIAPSKFMKNICVDFGIPDDKIAVIENFLSRYSSFADVEKLAENHILYFGRLSEEKGIKVLIKAMQKIRPEIRLKIVGDGPERANLSRMIDDLKLNGRIEMIGHISFEKRAELERLINNAKAIIIPSVWFENMPYSLIEAMSHKKTVIASDIGGMPELITDNENGILFTPGDPDDLAEKINSLDDDRIMLMGERASETIKKLSPQNYYESIINIYKKVKNEKK